MEERDHLEDLGLDGGNIKEFLKKLRLEAFHSTHVAWSRDKSQAVANKMTSLGFSIPCG